MINTHKIKAKNLFQLDAIGALLSLCMNGFVLPYFSIHLGIEKEILRKLAFIALTFMIYDIVIYLYFKVIRLWMIKIIIFLNLSYVLLSCFLKFYLPHITHWGLAILIAESATIIVVILFEFKLYQRFLKEEVI